MANTLNSNIPLPLPAQPQGSYTDDDQLKDMSTHFSSTQTLSQVLSDAATVRILFLVGVTAGKFIQANINAVEAIGTVCAFGTRPIGFLLNSVAPGEYGVVCSSGVNRFLTGLSPGVYYQSNGSGDVTPELAGLGPRYVVGYAVDTTTLAVHNIGWTNA